MLNLFRNYNPYSVIVLFLLALFLKFATLIHPETAFVISKSQFVWIRLGSFIETILGHSIFLITFFALCNLFGQALFLNSIANRHHLFPKNNYLPAFTYILVSSLFKDWNYLSAALMSNWLILAMLSSVLKLYTTSDAGKQIFNVGCFISLVCMLEFPNIVMFLLLLLSLAILRPFKIAEWTVALLGLLTPFYFLAGLLYLTNNLQSLHKMMSIGFSLPNKIDNPFAILASFSFLVLMIVTGIYYLTIFMNRMLFQNKKWWWIIFISFITCLAAGIFTVAKGYNQWLIMLVPISFIITNVWFEERRKWISSVLFYLFIGVIIFAQWF